MSSLTVRLVNGREIDLNNPDWSGVSFAMLAWPVRTKARYGGNTYEPHTVLHHQHLMARYVRKFFSQVLVDEISETEWITIELQCKAHDMHEGPMGDILYPIRKAIPELDALDAKCSASFMAHMGLGEQHPIVTVFDRFFGALENGVLLSASESDRSLSYDGLADRFLELCRAAGLSVLPPPPATWDTLCGSLRTQLRTGSCPAYDQYTRDFYRKLWTRFVLESSRTSRMVEVGAGTLTVQEAFSNAIVGLVGELGEFVDLCKKIVFHKKPVDKARLNEEFGDLCWYIAEVEATSDARFDLFASDSYTIECDMPALSVVKHAVSLLGLNQTASLYVLDCVRRCVGHIDFASALSDNVLKLKGRYPEGFKPYQSKESEHVVGESGE